MDSVFIEHLLNENAIFIIVAGMVLTFYFFASKKRRDALKKLSSYLPGSVSSNILFSSFKGNYQGLDFVISLYPKGDDGPNYLAIAIIKNSFFKLRIYKDNALINLGKNFGIIHEVKINDEAFGKGFVILSDKPAQAINYLSNSSIKNTIRELFNKGFTFLIVDGKKFGISKPKYNLNIDLEPQKVLDALQKLSILAKVI